MPSESSEPDFDVGIIGGGPAGAAMGGYLAKAGVRCVVLERELFPRPHVGESLVPSSTRVFKELDFLRTMDEAGFLRKYGAAWTSGARGGEAKPANIEMSLDAVTPDCHAEIRFEERAQPGVDRNYTFHVDRGKFDLLLLQHANRLGAEVYEGVRVRGVDFDDGPFPAVRFDMGRRAMDVRVRMVVDASGRSTLLGNQLKLKVKDPMFDQYAIHAWFEGYDRGAWAKSDAQREFIFIHFLPVSNTWIWQIPITGSVTSIGVVTQKKNFAASRVERERFFWDTVATRPDILEPLRRATRVNPFKDEGDYSYAMTQIAGDRFVLIGDAARFVDPIFSTGVSIALNSARLASRDVLGALERGDFTRGSFGDFEATIRRGTKNWYEFISVYYRLNILFSFYVNHPRYRLDVLKLLQGDVYDEAEPEVLVKMRSAVSEIERNDQHIWHGLLNEMTQDAFRPTG
jgi:FADH2 O2-dependent halogenase